jgi:hypothetical protein
MTNLSASADMRPGGAGATGRFEQDGDFYALDHKKT